MIIGKEPDKKLIWIYQSSDNPDEILLGYKGGNEFKGPIFYAPYMPFYKTPNMPFYQTPNITRWQRLKWRIKYWFRRIITEN